MNNSIIVVFLIFVQSICIINQFKIIIFKFFWIFIGLDNGHLQTRLHHLFQAVILKPVEFVKPDCLVGFVL